MTNILVVGGAGYIGSHMVKCLDAHGLTPVILDNLESGRREAVEQHTLIVGDCGDSALLSDIFAQYDIDAVMHFASHIQVGESVANPGKYYDNNVARTIALLNAMVDSKVRYFIFSSTAAIFGNPVQPFIDEQHPKAPINPYGRSKLLVEELLQDYQAAYGLQYGCLRYFNAAGAHPDGTIGECHEPETHLIPLILQAASGRRDEIKIFGDDYDTPDGTCVRDYIHVCDLSEAHYLLLKALQNGLPSAKFNLGTGRGHSVREVIDAARAVTGRDIKAVTELPRAGDPAQLVANGEQAKTALGWTPTISDLSTMIAHAWAWEQHLLNEQH